MSPGLLSRWLTQRRPPRASGDEPGNCVANFKGVESAPRERG